MAILSHFKTNDISFWLFIATFNSFGLILLYVGIFCCFCSYGLFLVVFGNFKLFWGVFGHSVCWF